MRTQSQHPQDSAGHEVASRNLITFFTEHPQLPRQLLSTGFTMLANLERQQIDLDRLDTALAFVELALLNLELQEGGAA